MEHSKLDPADRALIDLARELDNDVLPLDTMDANRIIHKEIGLGAVRDPAKYGVIDPDEQVA
jgi:hypothetical protein